MVCAHALNAAARIATDRAGCRHRDCPCTKVKPLNIWAPNDRRRIAAGTETPGTPTYYHSRQCQALRVSRREDGILSQSARMLRFPAI